MTIMMIANSVSKSLSNQWWQRYTSRFNLLLCLSLISLGLSSHSHAQEIDLGTAAQYAGFFFGNVSNINNVAGRLAIGGNLSTGSASIGKGITTTSANSALPPLIVGGNILALTGGSIGPSSTSNGGLYLGSKASSVPASLNLKQAPYSVIDFAAENTYLSILSQQLNARTATGSVSQKGNTVTLTGSNSSIEIFNLSASQVGSGLTLALANINPSATLVLNIASNTQHQVQIGIVNTALQQRPSQVLYNFPDADVINVVNASIWGNVLAPVACINNSSGQIAGTVIAASWNASVSIGNNPFQSVN